MSFGIGSEQGDRERGRVEVDLVGGRGEAHGTTKEALVGVVAGRGAPEHNRDDRARSLGARPPELDEERELDVDAAVLGGGRWPREVDSDDGTRSRTGEFD